MEGLVAIETADLQSIQITTLNYTMLLKIKLHY